MHNINAFQIFWLGDVYSSFEFKSFYQNEESEYKHLVYIWHIRCLFGINLVYIHVYMVFKVNIHECLFKYISVNIYIYIRAVISTIILVMENLSRDNNHTNSFRKRHQEQDTELSNHSWQPKCRKHQLHPKMKNSSLCLDVQMWVKRVWPLSAEKYVRARANQKNLLNKKPELTAKRRHRNKYILKISNNS